MAKLVNIYRITLSVRNTYTLNIIHSFAVSVLLLKARQHTLRLPPHNTSLSDCNFITGILYKECY